MNDKAKFIENITLGQKEKIDLIRSSFSNMYDVIDINCKESRETELAIAKLEEAQMWVIKGITRESEI